MSAKRRLRKMHRYYDSMCDACGDFNYAKREQTANLDGHYALVTGARVKIGFQASLKLLRAGAHVIVTTRFPVDAADRYSKETDFPAFRERLQIHGVDLRHTPERRNPGTFPGRAPAPPRLHSQQRLPDRAPTRRFLSASPAARSGVDVRAASGAEKLPYESRRAAS